MPSKASVRCKTTNSYPEWATPLIFNTKIWCFYYLHSLVLIVSNGYPVLNTWVALYNFKNAAILTKSMQLCIVSAHLHSLLEKLQVQNTYYVTNCKMLHCLQDNLKIPVTQISQNRQADWQTKGIHSIFLAQSVNIVAHL